MEATAASPDSASATGFWAGLTRAGTNQPVAGAAMADGHLVVLALSGLGIEDGLLGIPTPPENDDSRRADEVLAGGLRAGLIAPVEVVAAGPSMTVGGKQQSRRNERRP